MAAVDDGVLRVELAVCLLEGLCHALNALDDVHALEEEGINLGGVADNADDRLFLAGGDVRLIAAILNPLDEVAELLRGGGVLYDGDHVFPLNWRITKVYEC